MSWGKDGLLYLSPAYLAKGICQSYLERVEGSTDEIIDNDSLGIFKRLYATSTKLNHMNVLILTGFYLQKLRFPIVQPTTSLLIFMRLLKVFFFLSLRAESGEG